MDNSKILFTNDVGSAIDSVVDYIGSHKAIVIADVNTAQFVLPKLRKESKHISSAECIIIRAGEDGKSLEELSRVWRELSRLEATRVSTVINVGGGVVTDLGGFAAATFKRGMHFINVPTTLLCAVDACIGGKNGINFNGVKNQIGTFADPDAIIISTKFFSTLPTAQVLSGYGEMLKHALLDSPVSLGKLLTDPLLSPCSSSNDALLPLIKDNVLIKKKIVDKDPHESGLRKILNLGHTAGHAFESLSYSRANALPHGYSVAAGLVVTLILSHINLGFPSTTMHQVADFVRSNYELLPIGCKDYPELLRYMRCDKKNTDAGMINFTLLKAVGDPQPDVALTPEKITPALDIYRDLMGLA